MAVSPKLAIKLFGTQEPAGEPRILTAGPLTAELEDGNLRYIRINGVEAIRALAFIVRDRNWGTYKPKIENLAFAQKDDGFEISYKATCEDGEQALEYITSITGAADGSLSFRGTAKALTAFETNRTGFVVLHPIEGISGQPVEVERVDGSREHSTFPLQVDPTCPFQDLRALTHEVLPGLKITCRMEGDAFEMEDHRNWMDASYKTYVRPLAKPWPYTLQSGESAEQSVTLSIDGEVASRGSKAGSDPVRITLGSSAGKIPEIGISLRPEYAASTLAVADLVTALQPKFLVSPFDSRVVDGWSGEPAAGLSTFRFDSRLGARGDVLGFYRRMSEISGQPLILEAVVACRNPDGSPSADTDIMRRDVSAIAKAVDEAGVKLSALAVSPASDLKCTLPGSVWPPCPSLEDLYEASRAAFPGLLLGGGMFSFFTEFNRKRPPVEHLDFVTHTTSPIVHASDDRTVTENLEALPHVIASTRHIVGNAHYRIGPSYIGARDNPYGAMSSENPGNGRVALARMDPRQRGLLGAAWHLGYLAHCIRGGVDAVTLSAPVGDAGLVYQATDYSQPWFDEHGGVYPAYHVLRGLCAASNATAIEVQSGAPGTVQGLAYESGETRILWLANLSGENQQVLLEGADSRVANIACLDANSFETFCKDPKSFETEETALQDGPIRLGAYAVARLRLEPLR